MEPNANHSGTTQRRIASLREQLADGDHLRFDDEIMPYVDGRLDGDAKRQVEAHLHRCLVCRREVEELREFAATERRAAPRRTGVAAALATAAAIAIGFTVLMRKPQPAPAPVVTRSEPPLAAALHDGTGIIGIDRKGKLRGAAIDAALAQRLATALTNPDLPPPAALVDLLTAPGQLRGTARAGEDLAVVSPVGIAVVATRPQLTWRGESSAPYEITLLGDGTSEIHGRSRGDHWTPDTDLARGRTYTWQVATTLGGRRVVAPAPPAPPALFRIVDQKTADAIKAAKSHLVAGLLAYEAGALADARSEFEALAVANPSSPIPPKLIASCNRAMKR